MSKDTNGSVPTITMSNGDEVTPENYDEYVTTPKPWGALNPHDYKALADFGSWLNDNS